MSGPASGGESDSAARIVPLHTGVQGRIRCHARGLKGSPSRVAILCEMMATFPDIQSVTASAVTGNVIVIFAGTTDLSSVLVRLEVCLDCEGRLPQAGSGEAWHALPVAHVAEKLGTRLDTGLTFKRADERLRTEGPNELSAGQIRTPLQILAGQFSGAPVAMLACAAGLSLVSGGLLEAAAIAGVLALNALLGYVTESRAESVLSSLGRGGAGDALVLRDGRQHRIPIARLVRGDLLLLQRGDLIPADARLVQCQDLSVSEAALTGESLPLRKAADEIGADMPLARRSNMLHRGTIIVNGSGKAVVVATGPGTELGRVQRLVDTSRPPATPTERQLEALGSRLVWITAGAAALLVLIGLLRGVGLAQILRSALSLAVASVPEGLPMIATTAHALGVEAMRGQDILVRRLDALETMASVDVICFDKTGTLTENRMSVVDIRCAGDPLASVPDTAIADDPHALLLQIAALCNEVEVNGANGRQPIVSGSATETALVLCANESGLDVGELHRRLPREWLRQRTDAYRFMISQHRLPDGAHFVAMKGSPADVLARCGEMCASGGQRIPLTRERRSEILSANDGMARRGLRVLGFACARGPGLTDVENGELRSLCWVGLAGLADPIRPGAREAMEVLRRAGIRPLILTGDQCPTAQAVAEAAGIADAGGTVVDASALDTMSGTELADLARRASVFAQITPAQKLRVVERLQQTGSVVAMVGDGINDSPALRRADVGIAMSLRGDVAASEVADILLRTEDLSRLPLAVAQGRTTRRNIRKSLRFLIGTNSSEVALMLGGAAAGLGELLSPMQLLWINLATDVAPGVGLAMEPPGGDIMSEPPKPRDAPLPSITDGKLLVGASAMAGGAFAASLYGALRYGYGAPQMQTMAFGTVVAAQLHYALACRSEPGSRASLPPNPALMAILAGTAAAQGAAMMIPGLRRLLGLSPLGALDCLAMALCSAAPALLGGRSGGGWSLKPRAMSEAPQPEAGLIRYRREHMADECASHGLRDVLDERHKRAR